MNKDIYITIRKNLLNKKVKVRENFVSANLDENLLLELWYRQWFDRRNLKTIDGKNVVIISPGERSTSSCPDFVNAKLSVDGKLYCGDVEIHKKRSDWFLHKHSYKKEYKNVILHLFYQHDTSKPIDKILFEICLKDRIDPDRIYTLEHLDRICLKEDSLCGKMLLPKDYEYLESLLISAAEVRLILKSEKYNRLFIDNITEEQILYENICEVYGYNNNRNNFLLLSKLVPLEKLRKLIKFVAKNKTEVVYAIESVYFGVSGLLEDLDNDLYMSDKDSYYINKILSLWGVLKKKINKKIDFSCWKFYKTRPLNYPHRRIAALSRTISNFVEVRIPQVLYDILTHYEGQQIIQHIIDIFYQPADGFFANRCSFTSKLFNKKFPLFGEEKVASMIVNVILPFYVYYAKKHNDKELYNKIVALYKNLKFKENNEIVKKFIKKIVKYSQYHRYFISRSMLVQGFIQIYKDFCEPVHSCCEDCFLLKILSNREKMEYDDSDFKFIEL